MSAKVLRAPIERKTTMDETIAEGLNFLRSGCRTYDAAGVLGKRRTTRLPATRTRSKSPSSKRKRSSSPSPKKSTSPKKTTKRSTSPKKTRATSPKKTRTPSSPKKSTPTKSKTTTTSSRTTRTLSPKWTEIEQLKSDRRMKSTGEDKERLTEIIFTFDTTGSMGEAINQAKQNIIEITNRLFDSVSNLRVGMIAHGDYCDSKDAIFQVSSLSNEKQPLIDWINSVKHGHGGDAPENYEQVIEYAAQHVEWTEGSHRVLVVIGDCIPHEPEECLSQMKRYNIPNPRAINWIDEVDQCWQKGIKIYGVRANKHSTTQDDTDYFYESMAARTCGTTLQLQNFPMLTDMLLMVCFREADRVMFDDFRAEVQREGRMDAERQEMFDKVAA